MKKFSLLISCTLISACSSIDSTKPFDQQQAAVLLQQHGSTHPSKQMVSLNLPKKETWKKTSFSPDEISSFVILVPQQESVTHFSESIQGRTLPYEYTSNVTAMNYVAAEFDQAKQYCQQTTANILSENTKEVTYRLNSNQCQDKKNQWQFGKVFNGEDGVYSVRYVAEAETISKARFDQLAQVIKSAVLIRDPRASL